MAPTNRVELIPLQVFAIEMVIVVPALLAVVVAGPVFVFAIVGFMVTAYALGAYDRRPHSMVSRLTRSTVAALLMSAALAAFVEHGPSLVYSIGAVFFFALLHVLFGRLLELSATPVTITYPYVDGAIARTLRELATHLHYPAVFFEAEDHATWSATFPRARSGAPSGTSKYTVEIDPMAFCQNAIRAIPPALFERHTPRRRRRALYAIVKRAVDIIASAVVIAVTLPLWAVAAIGILIADGRPIFFRQSRIGKHANPITILKFRSLRTEDDGSTDPTAHIERRSFAFGVLLRRTRIDELPQLLQVLTGKMSMVGPRPEMLFYHERSLNEIPSYERRLDATPGLTGWAQIHYAHSVTSNEYVLKTALDLWYIQNRGIVLDTQIMLKTVGILLRRFGSK